MENSRDTDSLFEDFINDEVRQRRQDEFPRAFFASGSSQIWKPLEGIYRVINFSYDLSGNSRVLLEKIISDLFEVVSRFRSPGTFHLVRDFSCSFFSMRLTTSS